LGDFGPKEGLEKGWRLFCGRMLHTIANLPIMKVTVYSTAPYEQPFLEENEKVESHDFRLEGLVGFDMHQKK